MNSFERLFLTTPSKHKKLHGRGGIKRKRMLCKPYSQTYRSEKSARRLSTKIREGEKEEGNTWEEGGRQRPLSWGTLLVTRKEGERKKPQRRKREIGFIGVLPYII